jgi:hypothetical protein
MHEQAAQDHLRGELATADYLTWSSTHLSFCFLNFKIFMQKAISMACAIKNRTTAGRAQQ